MLTPETAKWHKLDLFGRFRIVWVCLMWQQRQAWAATSALLLGHIVSHNTKLLRAAPASTFSHQRMLLPLQHEMSVGCAGLCTWLEHVSSTCTPPSTTNRQSHPQ
jgi:hypothetical protein